MCEIQFVVFFPVDVKEMTLDVITVTLNVSASHLPSHTTSSH